jgi:hypothetical protein
LSVYAISIELIDSQPLEYFSLVYQGYVEPSKFVNVSVSLVAESKSFKRCVAVSSTVFIPAFWTMFLITPVSSLRRLQSAA